MQRENDLHDLNQLSRLIDKELSKCSSQHWPEICRLSATEAGRAEVIRRITLLALEEGMPPSSAMALLEQDFSHAQSPQL